MEADGSFVEMQEADNTLKTEEIKLVASLDPKPKELILIVCTMV